jgi:uncharacterized protein (TIGR02391 family)
MLNLEPELDHRLWTAIKNAYENGNYTAAILNSIHFLSELIREKTGLEADGVPLVNQAFGGDIPKLKVTKFKTTSDKDIQKGTEHLVRGLFQAVRNPRSHENYTDPSQDALALILFINYLVRVIDKAKVTFDKEAYLRQVFDPAFSETDKYAELLVGRIPPKKRLEILLEIYRNKESGIIAKLKYFFRALLKTLSDEDIDEFYAVVSHELETTSNDATIIVVIGILPSEYWCKCSELAQIRTEERLIASIRDGKYNRRRNKCLWGSLGAWGSLLLSRFVLKNKLVTVLSGKLDSADPNEQDYVFRYFFPGVFIDFPNSLPLLVSALRKGLRAGDFRFRDAASALPWDIPWEQDNPWVLALKDDFVKFVESPPIESVTDDDIPF